MEGAKYIILRHPISGTEREIKKGYSWTVCLLGIIALLFRGQWIPFSIAAGALAIDFILGGIIPPILFWIGWAIYAGVANEHLLESLLKRGFEVTGYIVEDKVVVNVEDATMQSSLEGEETKIDTPEEQNI